MLIRKYSPLFTSHILLISFCLIWPAWVSAAVGLPVYVKETAGVARQNEVIRSGLPIPRPMNLLDVSNLTLVDDTGAPVPAEFQITARWNAGLANTKAPIQWLLVTFQSSVAANGMAKYTLVTDGSAGPNPVPSTSVKLTRKGDQVIIDTGKAVFKLAGNKNSLFDEIRLANGTNLVSPSTLSAQVNSASTQLSSTLRRISIEHKGPLIAIVVVEGVYDLPAIGGGKVSSALRYIFSADSEVAMVRHAVKWEGDFCTFNGWDTSCDWNKDGVKEPNGLLVNRISDPLKLNLGLPLEATVIGNYDQPELVSSLEPGQTAFISQALRNSNLDALTYSVQAATATQKGLKATGGVLALKGRNGTVAVALNHMHRYEPQALRLAIKPTVTANSIYGTATMEVDIADDKMWLGQRQGMFAHFAVGAFDIPPSRDSLNRVVWAALNHPLHALPTPYWLGTPDRPTQTAWPASYDNVVPKVLNTTLNKINEQGLSGLMTFGLYPRYWGSSSNSQEVSCLSASADPTLGTTWDNAYWCATWTDYHNTTSVVSKWVLRSGDPNWLDEIAFPAAERSLFTQIMQCSPDDKWSYCGQSPAGYGGYRNDFNSSHGYFENLLMYYWLTGDATVVETLQRGANTMRSYMCSKRPAKPCLDTDPDPNNGLTYRVASQWNLVFRFMGLASSDASFLQDWKSNLSRAVTQNYVEAIGNNISYGFWGDKYNGAGTYSTGQLWMVSMYDMKRIYQLAVDTKNAPIGAPAVLPMDILAAWSRTLLDYGAVLSGDGTAKGKWPNALYFTVSGKRIGGSLDEVKPKTTGGDPYLYNSGKSALIAPLSHAGDYTQSAELTKMARDIMVMTQSASLKGGPLSKAQGEYMTSLPEAHEIVWGVE